jgi:Cft2 family RNA processing exonuclease
MEYEIVATGSTGNCVLINKYIAVDMGVTFKKIKPYYKDFKLVLLTHIHNDHFKNKTIAKLARERPTLYFGCCEWLVEDLVKCDVEKKNIIVMDIGKMYDFGTCRVSPIKLYHDVPQNGYRIFIGDEKAIYATDTAHMDGISAKDYDLYLIEGNYYEDELQEKIKEKQEKGEFCYEYRVPRTHLSVQQATEWLMENMGEKSEYALLHGHVEKSTDWEYADT